MKKLKYWLLSLKHGDLRLWNICISFGLLRKTREHKLSTPSCKVKKADDFLFLYGLDGQRLPHQISIEIFEGVNQQARAKVELFVDLSEL